MPDLPHPDRCEWCAAAAAETGGVVGLCLDHRIELDNRRAARRLALQQRQTPDRRHRHG